MPLLPTSKVEEFCRKTGWTFYTQFIWEGNYWRSRFLDSNGSIMVQTLHKNVHSSMGLAVNMAKSQQDILLSNLSHADDELPGPFFDDEEEGKT